MCSWRVEIRKSTIPDAGNGLFATDSFSEGDTVCEYTGKVLSLLQAMKSEDKSYMMGGFGLNVHLDAKDDEKSMGKYINDPLNEELVNVKFVKLKSEKKALVVALKHIECGQELFVSYGECYWRARTGTRLVSTEHK